MAAYPRTRIATLTHGDLVPTVAMVAGTAFVGLVGTQILGEVGFVAPLLAVVALALLQRPVVTTFLAVALVILAEGNSFGILTFSDAFYTNLLKGVTVTDVMFMLAITGTGMRLLVEGRKLEGPPRELAVPMILLLCAVPFGVIVGKANGGDGLLILEGFHWCLYFVILPLLIINLHLNAEQLRKILLGAGALAVVKAILGLAQIAVGKGATIDGESTLTYYASTANWVMMVVALWVLAAVLGGHRIPRWLLLGAPLVLTCLLLSYRRSFWIGLALAVALVVLFGLSPLGRRLIVPTVALIGLAVALVGSYVLPGDSPVVRRATTINPASISANQQDRYRLDERANVIANIREDPIAGRGLAVPWTASERTMGLDHSRQYVHFVSLYWWLKLGILGFLWYGATILGGAAMSFRVWRRSHDPALRALGLGSFAAMIGLVPIEMTATFTGLDPRFSVVLASQLGILAALVLKLRPSTAERTLAALTEPPVVPLSPRLG